MKEIRAFLVNKDIDLLLSKGGMLEKDLFSAIGIECQNLEEYGAGKYTEQCHPLDEVNYFHKISSCRW